MESLKVVNLKEKLALFHDYWAPRIVGDLNQDYIKVAKFKGEFIWHSHEEDELFFVLKGNLCIHLRDQDLHLREGEFLVIPKGVEHKPYAKEEAHVLLIEPKNTLNTGNVEEKRTLKNPQRL